MPSIEIVLVVSLALAFDLLNGIRDSSNIVATMISSRSISPQTALIITAMAEFAGPFLFGVAVAKTLVEDVVAKNTINLGILIAALSSAIIWNIITWLLGLPSSSSHALIGGLVGSVICGAGWNAVRFAGLEKVLIALFTSPIIGFVIGYGVSQIVTWLSRNASPRINFFYKKAQVITAIALALSHGSNDGQKTMGIITLGLVTAGYLNSFSIPTWVMVSCAGVIALGTTMSGKKLIRTMGSKFYKIRPVDSFNTQLTSTIVILGASLLGGPVSTTQVVSSAIMGVGAAERVNKVRWGVAGEIAIAWLLTIPASALLGAGFYFLINLI
jgi:inorganic phosphate transporter, PiT family